MMTNAGTEIGVASTAFTAVNRAVDAGGETGASERWMRP